MGEKQIFFFQAIKLQTLGEGLFSWVGRSHSQGPRHSEVLRTDLQFDWKCSHRLFTGIDV